MKYNSIDQITADEVKNLIQAQTQENTHLEYKRDIKFRTDVEKKELLTDVCSFANSGGGIILYGIEEEKDDDKKNTGVPKQTTGLIVNTDEMIRQLNESMRLTPKSWSPPNQEEKWIGSISKGKYEFRKTHF